MGLARSFAKHTDILRSCYFYMRINFLLIKDILSINIGSADYHLTGENFRQLRLNTWTLFIDQFVQPVGGEGMGLRVSLF